MSLSVLPRRVVLKQNLYQFVKNTWFDLMVMDLGVKKEESVTYEIGEKLWTDQSMKTGVCHVNSHQRFPPWKRCFIIRQKDDSP